MDGITDKLMEMFRKEQNLIDALLPELTRRDAPSSDRLTSGCPSTTARFMVLREFTTGVPRRAAWSR